MIPRLLFWVDLAVAFATALGSWLMLPDKAAAAELIVHGPSHHFDQDAGYNDQNYGLGYVSDLGLAAGVYRNSINRVSVYAGYRVRLAQHVGVVVGAVTGYEQLPIMPAALLNITAPLSNGYRVHVNVVPLKGGLINLSIGKTI